MINAKKQHFASPNKITLTFFFYADSIIKIFRSGRIYSVSIQMGFCSKKDWVFFFEEAIDSACFKTAES